jgi:hypothetical protein
METLERLSPTDIDRLLAMCLEAIPAMISDIY